ncbi:hypothetical protein BH09BAC1_BH09BAC1_04170 [soil metagenome]
MKLGFSARDESVKLEWLKFRSRDLTSKQTVMDSNPAEITSPIPKCLHRNALGIFSFGVHAVLHAVLVS